MLLLLASTPPTGSNYARQVIKKIVHVLIRALLPKGTIILIPSSLSIYTSSVEPIRYTHAFKLLFTLISRIHLICFHR